MGEEKDLKSSGSSNDSDQCTASQCTKIIDIVALIVALAATIALFSLPIVFHFAIRYSDGPDTTNSTSSMTNISSTSCSSTDTLGSWGEVPIPPAPLSAPTASAPCSDTGYVYNSDGVCNTYLKQWLKCAARVESPDDAILLINGSYGVQVTRDADISSLELILDIQPTCKVAAMPFLCQFYFPLKDCSTNTVYTASQETCLTISTSLCASLWQLGVKQFPDKLPDCYSLPKSVSANESTSTLSTNSSVSNISCSSGFDRLNNSCIPRCDKFKLNSDAVTTALITSEILAVTVGLITCLVIALFAIPNYKNMLSFPSVFMLFILVDFVCAAIVVIVSAVNRHGLYCGSTDLLDTLDSPTFFCSLSGVVFHYSLVSMTAWWFMHVSVFFYKVMMPFHARHFFNQEKQKKLTFTILTLSGFLLPVIPVIVVLTTDGYQLSRFPPSLCTPNGGKFFYSASLIINILLCTGVCFLICIFWVIHTNRHFRANREKNQLSTAEKKIMIVFIWFTIFGVFVMIESGILSAQSKDLVTGLTRYLGCESIGDPQTVCDRQEFEKYTHPYLLMVTYILLGLIPLSILNFVVNIRLIKAFVKKYWKSGRMLVSGSEHSTASTNTNMSTSSRTSEFKSQTTELSMQL